jgi:hypothetical protein
MPNVPVLGNDPSDPNPPPPRNNISNLAVAVDADVLGATVTFNIISLAGAGAFALVRSFSNSTLAAKSVFTPFRALGAQKFDDRDATIVGKTVWYWVQVEDTDLQFSVFNGPVSVKVATGAGPPVSANWMEVSGDDDDGSGSMQINIACEFAPGVDMSGGILVYVQNYEGSILSLLMFQGDGLTFSFHLRSTQELASIAIAAVDASGNIGAPSVPVNFLLNGSPTKPCRLTGLSCIEGDGFTQVSFLAGMEDTITEYRLYRSAFGGTFAGAVLVASIKRTSELTYSIQDRTVNGGVHAYQWYVTAVNVYGESTSSEALFPANPW